MKNRNPVGPPHGSSRVRRGGSWSLAARFCRSAIRVRDAPVFRYFGLGFRVIALKVDRDEKE